MDCAARCMAGREERRRRRHRSRALAIGWPLRSDATRGEARLTVATRGLSPVCTAYCSPPLPANSAHRPTPGRSALAHAEARNSGSQQRSTDEAESRSSSRPIRSRHDDATSPAAAKHARTAPPLRLAGGLGRRPWRGGGRGCCCVIVAAGCAGHRRGGRLLPPAAQRRAAAATVAQRSELDGTA